MCQLPEPQANPVQRGVSDAIGHQPGRDSFGPRKGDFSEVVPFLLHSGKALLVD